MKRTKPVVSIDASSDNHDLNETEVVYVKLQSGKIIPLNHCRGGCDGFFEDVIQKGKRGRAVTMRAICTGCQMRSESRRYELIFACGNEGGR